MSDGKTYSATADDIEGMNWWNALTEQERAEWMARAGNTGRAEDAWKAFKLQRDDDASFRMTHLGTT